MTIYIFNNFFNNSIFIFLEFLLKIVDEVFTLKYLKGLSQINLYSETTPKIVNSLNKT